MLSNVTNKYNPRHSCLLGKSTRLDSLECAGAFNGMKKEIWKKVPGYEKSHLISNMGRVKTLDRYSNHRHKGHKRKVRSKILKGNNSWLGYWKVTLSNNGKQRVFYNHQLVAMAFIDKHYLKKGLCVNHKNANKGDCRLENIEIVTHAENMAHAKKLGLSGGVKGEKHRCAILKNKQIPKIRKIYSSGNYTQKEIGNKFGVSEDVIWHIVNNKTWKHIK